MFFPGGECVTKIVRIEWARLEGERPRAAGCNARMGAHGRRVSVPLARVTTDAGLCGFGWSQVTREQAAEWVGLELDQAWTPQTGVRTPFVALEYPLWDLAGQMAGRPVYALIGRGRAGGSSLRVPCYDTSLYMDDLHLADDDAAAELIALEALEGVGRGHRAFKIKVGRGAMHMPVASGTRRDVCVIRAVREALGGDAPILIDANNGYNLNLAKQVLEETADAGVYWLEEPFHEDGRLYAALKEWMAARGIGTLIADGEGAASPQLLDWARQGLVDVVQYDIRRPGFTRWLALGPQLDAWGVRSAPHNYGGAYGNYSACHLAPHIERFEYVEWDEAKVVGLDGSAYRIVEGHVEVPDLPGFGLGLDSEVYERAVAESGYVV
jgi:L-alanine-DL-glutamate epimerase-like enolase superfamily enzyme